MRLLAACSLGGAGHLNPLVPFLATAEQQGAEVLVVGAPGVREMVEVKGYPFWAGDQPPEEVIAPIRERLSVVSREEASVLGNRELFGRLATKAMLEEMERAFAEWRPDLVLREPCEYASAIVAGRRGIPVAQVAISLAEAEAASIAAAAPALEEHRKGLVDELWSSPYLSAFPASLDPSPFRRTRRFRPPPHTGKEPVPDWWGGSEQPLVYVTLGTVLGHMSMAARVYRIVLGALEGLSARVLLTIGNRLDPCELGAVPDNVHVERWVDQERIMDDAALVVCHGGSGTVLGALAAGVPLVMVPLFADQFENARRVAGSGAGRLVDRGSREAMGGLPELSEHDLPRVRESVGSAMEDPSHRKAANVLAEEMAAAPGVDEILANAVA